MARNTNQTILTIGLELEMIVYHHSPPSVHDCINLLIAKHLRRGLEATFTNLLFSPYQAPVTHVGAAKSMLVVASSPCLTPVVDWIGDHPKLHHFFVTSEPDCLYGIPDNHRAFTASVEVRTPILRLGSWQFVVENVLRSLSAIPDINIRFTQQCGLHVHIGRRGGFELPHIKGLAKAVVIFEEDIERAWHPAHRWGVGGTLYADSNRKTSLSLKTLKTTLEMVRLIGQQNTISSVRGIMCDVDVGHRDFKYNFQSLVELGSIEFRQAQATLDEDWVVGWVSMLVKFVRAAGVVSEKQFEKFVEAVDNGENRLSEFLEWGVNEDGEGDEYNEEEIREERYRGKGRLDGRELVTNLGILPGGGKDDIICGLQSLNANAHFFL